MADEGEGGGDDGVQLEGGELYKHQFKRDFTARLTEIMSPDPNSEVTEVQVIKILEDLNRVAVSYGVSYIASDEPRYYDCARRVGYGVPRIGQDRCFMQLLREFDLESDEGRKMYNIKAQASHVGQRVSKHLLRMMVVMNIENKRDMMNEFSETVQMFSFLEDAFEWPGRSEHYGVVYNRINALLRHAHKEFVLQVTERATIPDGSLGYIEDLLINLDNKAERDRFLYDLLDEIIEVIAKLEALLSFPLLPQGSMVLSRNYRSVKWLHAELRDMEARMEKSVGRRVNEVLTKYTRNSDDLEDIEAFLNRVYSSNTEMWEDLESEVTQLRGYRLLSGRMRLHVKAKAIKLYRNRAQIVIVGVNTRKEAEWYIGKHIAYIYRTNVKRNGSHLRRICGKITRPHGDTGVLCAKFKYPLPRFRLNRLRVYMYRPRFNTFGVITYGD